MCGENDGKRALTTKQCDFTVHDICMYVHIYIYIYIYIEYTYPFHHFSHADKTIHDELVNQVQKMVIK